MQLRLILSDVTGTVIRVPRRMPSALLCDARPTRNLSTSGKQNLCATKASLLRRPAGAADRFSDRTLRKPRAEFQPQTPRVGQESSRFLHLRGSRSVSAELVRSTWLSNSACYGCLTMQTTTRHMMAMAVALRESE